MEYSINFTEAIARVLKYVFGGLIVAFVALILPNNKLELGEIWLLALTTACTFSILDLISPKVSNRERQDIGLGEGFQLVSFREGFRKE